MALIISSLPPHHHYTYIKTILTSLPSHLHFTPHNYYNHIITTLTSPYLIYVEDHSQSSLEKKVFFYKYTSISDFDETFLPAILDHSKTLFFYGEIGALAPFSRYTPPLPGGFGWGNKYTSLSDLDETLLPGILDHSKTLFFYGEIPANAPFSRYTPPPPPGVNLPYFSCECPG